VSITVCQYFPYVFSSIFPPGLPGISPADHVIGYSAKTGPEPTKPGTIKFDPAVEFLIVPNTAAAVQGHVSGIAPIFPAFGICVLPPGKNFWIPVANAHGC